MKYTRPAVAGAAALLAAGLAGAAAAPAGAQPASSSRIVSTTQLHVSIQHAVALAAANPAILGTGPAGQANA
ncbi:MAG TPA: hypothetical protein VMB79_07160 [Jatrophihabitans sp.]|nr:hypothetical protein [Jatrophihabitans sp.]